MAKKVVKKREVKISSYVARINVAGRVYEARGETVRDAIANLKIPNAKGRGVLTVSNGQVKKERVLSPYFVFRMFSSSPLTREVTLKNTTMLFDGI